MTKLPKKFKTKWIKALTSGEYKQGQYFLYHKPTNSFCCLGVACHISGIELKSQAKAYIDPDLAGDIIPKAIVYDLENEDVSTGLSDLNDSKVPFEVIAGFINENL